MSMANEAKLNQLTGQMLSDLGGASSVAMVRIGDALGLYKALHARGAMTTRELAAAVGANERYLREWLANQAASNYLSYDSVTQKFALPEEQAMIFAAEDSPVYMLGGFDLMAAMLDNQPKVEAAFRTGGGVAWGEQAGCMFCAVARFFRPGYHNHLIGSIEDHYSELAGHPTPMDIEWAKDGEDGKLYIVQARPETVASRRAAGAFETYALKAVGPVLATGRAVGEKIASGKVRVVADPHDLAAFHP